MITKLSTQVPLKLKNVTKDLSFHFHCKWLQTLVGTLQFQAAIYDISEIYCNMRVKIEEAC